MMYSYLLLTFKIDMIYTFQKCSRYPIFVITPQSGTTKIGLTVQCFQLYSVTWNVMIMIMIC